MLAPVVAVMGDLFGALLVTAVLIVPGRLLWRKLTRPLERAAWTGRLSDNKNVATQQFTERLRDFWLDGRLGFAVRLEEARESGEVRATLDIEREAMAAWAFSAGIGQISLLQPESLPPALQKQLIADYLEKLREK